MSEKPTTPATTPRRPPWKDMPPLPDGEDLGRVRGEEGGLVEEDVAEAAAEDDAEDHPGEEVVGLLRAHGRGAAPERRAAAEEGDVAPAEEQPGDVGERVPADGELEAAEAEREEDRVDVGEGEDEGHEGPSHRGRGRWCQALNRGGGCAETAGQRRGRAMEYRYLGRSGLRVSVMTMGTMTFATRRRGQGGGRGRARRRRGSRSTSASTPA